MDSYTQYWILTATFTMCGVAIGFMFGQIPLDGTTLAKVMENIQKHRAEGKFEVCAGNVASETGTEITKVEKCLAYLERCNLIASRLSKVGPTFLRIYMLPQNLM